MTNNWYELIWGGINSQHSMFDFYWEIIYSILKKLIGILQTIMLELVVIFNKFGSQNREGKYCRHSMLAFPLFWAVTFEYLYWSIKDK